MALPPDEHDPFAGIRGPWDEPPGELGVRVAERLAGRELRPTWAKDYGAASAPKCLVGNLIEVGTLALIFGESNTGKSTLAIDLAVACARGATWHGRRTRKALAVYLPLEGVRGVRARVQAKILRDDLPGDLNFVDLTGALVNLLEPGSVVALCVTIAELRRTVAPELELLLIVDTFSRAMAGGDENSARDMGAAIGACDSLKDELGCTVILVHHAGKDSSKGARGHSSLRACVDTEIEVSGTVNPRVAVVRKQRDLPVDGELTFDLEPVEIGVDPETDAPITACVVSRRENVAAPTAPTGKNQQAILRVLRLRQADAEGSLVWTLKELRAIGRELGQSKQSAYAAVDGLVTNGLLTACVGGHRLTR